jgi:hypothetical protein
MAWFERVFGRFFPERAQEKMRGFRLYLDGESVTFPDAVSFEHDPSESFSMAFWFKTQAKDAEVKTQRRKKIPAMRVKISRLFSRLKPDGQWHHFQCSYDGGSDRPPEVIVHEPPPGGIEFWKG